MIYIANLFLAYCFCLTKKSSLNKTVVIQVKLSEEIKMSALFDLTGKTALVTGSARGLGFAYAEGLAVAGARVILNDIRETLLAESVDVLASKGYSAHGAAFDVTSEDAIEKAFSKLDAQGIHVDILINNAGIQYRKPMVELELENWQKVIDTNLTSAFLVSRAAAKRMIGRRSGGKIVNIGSLTSQAARPTVAPYTAAKGGSKCSPAPWRRSGHSSIYRATPLVQGIF